jgi:predicted RNA binding protein YcfA (HicA-like mRNA interferase family)
MSVELPVISGERLIKILVRVGFSVRRQAGSHVVLQKGNAVFSVPMHGEIKKSTLKAILKQSGLSTEDLAPGNCIV